ncbi:MAG: hypothetical protein M1282_02080 [Chloroflexi bacterium]|nr:hypothetical protein [Chloroflexota bacterium]
MSELKVLVEPMVMDISSQALHLDDLRLRLFLNWLMAHSGKMKAVIQPNVAEFQTSDMEEQFKLALRTWLEPMPVQGMLWEYRLILDEIAWWRDLDPGRLCMMADEMQ